MSKVGTSDSKNTLYCSFCGKSQHEVRKLIAGPTVFICDECVRLCRPIIEKKNKLTTQEVPSLLPHNAPTEALLKALAAYNGAFERIGAGMQDIADILREREEADDRERSREQGYPEWEVRLGLPSRHDASALAYFATGRDGCISMISNVTPDLCRAIFSSCRQGRLQAARYLQKRLEPLGACLSQHNPAALKYALSLLGLMDPTTRLPLVELDGPAKAAVARAITDIADEDLLGAAEA